MALQLPRESYPSPMNEDELSEYPQTMSRDNQYRVLAMIKKINNIQILTSDIT